MGKNLEEVSNNIYITKMYISMHIYTTCTPHVHIHDCTCVDLSFSKKVWNIMCTHVLYMYNVLV